MVGNERYEMEKRNETVELAVRGCLVAGNSEALNVALSA